MLFSDDSERIYQQSGLEAFTNNELKQCDRCLAPGPFSAFIRTLHHIQQKMRQPCPIQTALITAQAPTHKRVIHSLREWGVTVDESLFIGGISKAEFLKAFQADLFFDDQQVNCEQTKGDTTTAHVPHGVTNECEVK